MKVLFLNDVLRLVIVPREYPLNGDILTLFLRDEFTDEEFSPPVTFETLGKQLLVTITAQPTQFETQKKYQITLKNGAEEIYLGKCIVLDAGTDVQNYEYNTQTNVRFDYK